MPEPHRRRGVTDAATAAPRLRRLRSWRTLVPAAIGVTALALAAGAAAADVLPSGEPAETGQAGSSGSADPAAAAQERPAAPEDQPAAEELAAQDEQAGPAAAPAAGDLPAVADTYVVAERPDQAYGGAAKLTASAWQDWHSEAYLRFEVPNGTAVGEGVQLVLTLNRDDRRPPEVQLREVTGEWDEATSYADRPELGGVVTTAAVGDGDTLAFDVSRVVDGPGVYEFALVNSASQTVVSVHSSEQGSQGPRLAIGGSGGQPAPGGGTLCGASWQSESSGESYQEALARLDSYYGGLESVRVFYPGLPADWPGKVDADGRPMVVSFKAKPADVIAGRHDERLSRWFREAPRDQDIYWSFFHEPEDNIQGGEYTADEYRRAWRHLSELASEVDNPRLYATLILMGWTVNPQSGRDWTDYFPGREYLDVIAWDLYNPGWKNNAYRPVEDIFRRVIETSREIGLPWGIAETGSGLIEGDSGEGRARWLRELTAHLSAEGALFVQYFDIDWSQEGAADYRLRDEPGKAAWRDFCTS
ncbi:MAG TPA: DNRLRE domain-containing protein [Natronosporangium sp.]